MATAGPRRKPPVLCIDDDEHLLAGLQRVLHSRFAVTTASSGAEGLQLLAQHGPFAVIVSDMRMPEIDGVEVLRRAHELAPLTVRVLLTGQADLKDAIGAVNEGHIYRFMTKPCLPRDLLDGLADAVQQYRVLISERLLLEKTLHSSIAALTDVLALTHPAAFGRSTRARRHVQRLAAHVDVPDQWLVEIAAMLSQLGCVTLPPETAGRLYRGDSLSSAELEMVNRLPEASCQLLAHIPRLDPVLEMLRYQQKRFDGRGIPHDALAGQSIPLGARILKIVLDYDELLTRDVEPALALHTMLIRQGWYDPDILDTFVAMAGGADTTCDLVVLDIAESQPGMIFYEDLHTRLGALVVARGQEVTPGLAARLHNLGRHHLATTVVRFLAPHTAPRTA